MNWNRYSTPNKDDVAEKAALALAESVILKADSKNPADAVLRAECKSSKYQLDARRLAWLVFSYYRWRGSLNKEEPIPAQIQNAEKLAELFRENPLSFSKAELTQAAVPEWVEGAMDVKETWLRSIQAEPTLWLRMRPAHETETVLALHPAVPGKLPHAYDYQGETDLFTTDLFHKGYFEIQDIASQAVSLLCAPQPGETWWDACAGQGGKTLHLSELMGNKGLIWSSDRAEWRLRDLKRRAARAGCFNYRMASWNGGVHLPTKTKFDGVLLDAPCSGLGTWQRNPHARWTTTLTDVNELAQLQQTLLANISTAVKIGGKLIYSVCTLTRAETTDVVEKFEATHPDFKPLKLVSPFSENTEATHPLWLWPEETKGNGMFVAGWERK
jgi:16S rRNA (cytosine967-C5)-methyltransferase